MLKPFPDPGALAKQYRTAAPFPHIVLDGLFDDSLLSDVVRDFPAPAQMKWLSFDNRHEKKLAWYHELGTLADTVRALLDKLNGFETLLWLEALTGIEGLIPDPYYGGGGVHQIEPGGFLKVHTDFNLHPKLKIYRRLNLLVYLNREWKDVYGGHLELWNADRSHCEQRILPLFNRTVVFSTSPISYHGHPQPLRSPDGMTRKSLSLYYYTALPVAEDTTPHDTIFVETMESDA